jgi:hypothetical protein
MARACKGKSPADFGSYPFHTFRLHHTALIYKAINSDQLYETWRLILEIHNVPDGREALREQARFCGDLMQKEGFR